MKLLHFRVGVVASCQKLGIILETKGDLKMDVQKMSITKNVLLNHIHEWKKHQKDLDDFWHRKLTVKVNFLHFSTHPYCTNLRNSMTLSDLLIFSQKPFFFRILPLKTPQRYCHTSPQASMSTPEKIYLSLVHPAVAFGLTYMLACPQFC